MTKKKKNEMPVYGVTCSKCNSDEIIMNTDTKELVCRNCGQVTEPDLILNSKDCNVKEVPTISINDIVSRNEDNINILDENTNRVFDMVTALETKVEELVGNVEDIRNHLHANSARIIDLQKGLSGCENRVDNIEDKIADICAELSRHKTTIKETSDSLDNLYKYYDNLNSEVCQNRKMIHKLGGELNDTDRITTFGELKPGDKFKIHGTTTPYLKVDYMDENKCLAYNILLCRCRTIPDDYLVVPIEDGDEE